MKFAKYLEDNLVPEWRAKYINYKGGKKKLKQVARALRHAEAAQSTHTLPVLERRTPASMRTNGTAGQAGSAYLTPNAVGYTPRLTDDDNNGTPPISVPSAGTAPRSTEGGRPSSWGRTMTAREGVKSPRTADLDRKTPKTPKSPFERKTPRFAPTPEEGELNPERTPLTQPMSHSVRAYGSIGEGHEHAPPQRPPSLILPDPLKPLEERTSMQRMRANTFDSADLAHHDDPSVGVLYVPGLSQSEPHFLDTSEAAPEAGTALPRGGPPTVTSTANHRPYLQRLFKNVALKFNLGRHNTAPSMRNTTVYLEMTEDAQRDFFEFLDDELEKITNFYNLKEQEAKERLMVLEQQIEIMMANRTWQKQQEAQEKAAQAAKGSGFGWTNGTGFHMNMPGILGSKKKADDDTKPTVAKLGATAAGVAAAPTSTREELHGLDPGRRDYNRKPQQQQPHVGYRTAKRKIKLAILEYYRGLELLKSYCLLNREGFRKILKKFDKTAHQRISAKYMNEKVHTASFATSDELDTLMGKVEELFATYWERGRRKHAVERLRTKDQKSQQTGAMFRVGVYLGSGVPFLAQALYLAFNDRAEDHYGMWHESEVSYLLQVWAGFGLPIIFMILFSLCCRAWSLARINYVFIFEFDKKHNIDWRQLLEIPALLASIMCFLMFFTFSGFWGEGIDRVWFPLIFLGVVFLIMFNPIRVCYYESRKWFLYAIWRVIWAGFYPVEFRDFWIGDMFCSMTYTLTTIPLVVCLYHQNWDHPVQCNSSNSRVLGFFGTLPGLWRLFQCFRRYHDTRNWFPHLVNGGKYLCTVMFYMSLSLWRMDKSNDRLRALFIFFAVLNSCYTTVWDLAMDWSLLDWDAPNKLLRTEMGFKRPSVYYAAMVIDPIIRFNWLLYIIFQQNVQHSAIVSFITSLTELFRRWVWCFFRLENEHCTNVGRFRAYRDDIPLPYNVPCPGVPGERRRSLAMSSLESVLEENGGAKAGSKKPRRPSEVVSPVTGFAESSNLERADTRQTAISMHSAASDRIRPPGRGRRDSATPIIRALSIVATSAAQAHAADFERRRPQTARSGLGRVATFNKRTNEEEEEAEDEDASSDDELVPTGGNADVTAASASGGVPSGALGGIGTDGAIQLSQPDAATLSMADRLTGLRRRGTGMLELSNTPSGTDVLQVSRFGGDLNLPEGTTVEFPQQQAGNGEGASNWATRAVFRDFGASPAGSNPVSPRTQSPERKKASRRKKGERREKK